MYAYDIAPGTFCNFLFPQLFRDAPLCSFLNVSDWRLDLVLFDAGFRCS